MCLLCDACFMAGSPFVAALPNFLIVPTVSLTRKLCYTFVGLLKLEQLCYPRSKFSYIFYCSPPVLVSDVLWKYDDTDGPSASVLLARNEIGESFFMHLFCVS
jgi:hypothetical protein